MKSRRKRKIPQTVRDDVTPERAAKNGFASIGMARRVIPVIDQLAELGPDKGGITSAEHRALTHYRDQASLAEKSPVRSCCDTSPRGGTGPGVAIISAQIETGRMERELGQLADIARAVAVDDKSLTQWCIDRYGGRERFEGGRFVGIAPSNPHKIKTARLELRYAAGALKSFVGA